MAKGGFWMFFLVKEGTQHYLYITYSEKIKGGYTTSLARGAWRGKDTQLSRIFQANTESTKGQHFGSRLVLSKALSLHDYWRSW